jgi:hypothetical protein
MLGQSARPPFPGALGVRTKGGGRVGVSLRAGNRLRGRRPGWGGVPTYGATRGEPASRRGFGGGTPGAHGRPAGRRRRSREAPFARAALAHRTGDRALGDDRASRGDEFGSGLTLGSLLGRTVDPTLRGARGEPPDPEQDREEPDAEVGAVRHRRGRSEYEDLVEGGRRTPPRNLPSKMNILRRHAGQYGGHTEAPLPVPFPPRVTGSETYRWSTTVRATDRATHAPGGVLYDTVVWRGPPIHHY